MVAVVVLRPLTDAQITAMKVTDLSAQGGDSNALREALKFFLADKLALYKQPREIVLVDVIPRNHLGKVNKKSLAKDLNLKL